MTVVSLRVPADLWERCGWMAEAKGVNRNEWVRTTLDNASRDAKPPNPREFRGIEASGEEWAEWERVAEGYGRPLSALIRDAFNHLATFDEKKEATA